MELFFNLSVLLEYNLKDYKTAIYYYTQYQASLLNYENALSEQAEPDPEKVKEIQFKISELEKHIRKLKAEYGVDYTDKIWSD